MKWLNFSGCVIKTEGPPGSISFGFISLFSSNLATGLTGASVKDKIYFFIAQAHYFIRTMHLEFLEIYQMICYGLESELWNII